MPLTLSISHGVKDGQHVEDEVINAVNDNGDEQLKIETYCAREIGSVPTHPQFLQNQVRPAKAFGHFFKILFEGRKQKKVSYLLFHDNSALCFRFVCFEHRFIRHWHCRLTQTGRQLDTTCHSILETSTVSPLPISSYNNRNV